MRFSLLTFGILFLVLTTARPIDCQTIEDSSLDFPSQIVAEGLATFILVEEKHFNRENLIKLFSSVAKSRQEKNLVIHVFSDRQILMRYFNNPPDMVGYLPSTPEGEKARKAYFERNRLPETGYFWAKYMRTEETESFSYNPHRDVEHRVQVTLRDNRVFASGQDYMLSSVENGYLVGVRSALAQWQKPDAEDKDGRTLLILALSQHHNDIVEELIRAGADVNFRGSLGLPPIMVAVANGNYGGVEILISNKAKVDESNRTGETALMAAVDACDVKMTDRLLKYGANPKAKNLAGKSVLDLACQSDEIRALLEKF